MKVAVAIYVADSVELVPGTVRSLFAAMPGDFSLCLLMDGVALPATMHAGHVVPPWVLHFPEAVGAPVCMNAWLSLCDADTSTFLLLENGLVLGHNCIDELDHVLASSPDIGLAGPSTNRAWNAQQLDWRCGQGQNEVHIAAAEIQEAYHGVAGNLGPLFSIGSFCLMFKREVLEAIGGADPGFGLGPCWEMDFHARAERMGLRGVHAKGAYCWRGPQTALLAAREQEAFDHSRRYYQDRLCGLQLNQTATAYEAHCLGDACEHFAPAGMTQLFIPLPAPDPAWMRPPALTQHALPLVSCIMPTANRPDYVALALQYFLAQDYPRTELIIIHDQPGDLPQGVEFPPNVRVWQVDRPLSIGNKRNKALELALGELIMLWDDDDWFHPARIRRQVMPLLLGWAEIAALQYATLYAVGEDRFWQPSVRLFHRMYKCQVLSGNLVFHRSILANGLRYPDISLAEDAYFLEWALLAGARMVEVHNKDLYIYIRHDHNTWRFRAGLFLQPNDWRLVDVPDYFAGYLDPYHRKMGRLAAPDPAPDPHALPLVSCIMPTADRPEFIRAAIDNFLRQDYPHKELIILDDGHISVAQAVPVHPAIRYLYTPDRRTIGAKRNAACHMSKGTVIMHWDDDDWAAPTWISTQVRMLAESQADITGLSSIRFYDPISRRAWLYEYPLDQPAWVAGATLCYYKAFWQCNPFPEINIGEDNAFVWSSNTKVIVPHDAQHLYAARVHHGNTSAKRTRDPRWRPIQYQEIEEMMEERP